MNDNNAANLPLTASPLRIFLVEDSLAVRDLIVEILADVPGIAIAGFSDSEDDALAQLTDVAWDVLILDIELKQGNGISLLRSMASKSIAQDSVKIIFSNNVSAAYRRISNQFGVQHFFDKTSEFSRLRSLLATMGSAAGTS